MGKGAQKELVVTLASEDPVPSVSLILLTTVIGAIVETLFKKEIIFALPPVESKLISTFERPELSNDSVPARRLDIDTEFAELKFLICEITASAVSESGNTERAREGDVPIDEETDCNKLSFWVNVFLSVCAVSI